MSENRASSKANYQGDWETPLEAFNQIAESFRFTLDVCASEKNTKCDTWIDKEQNALESIWKVDTEETGEYWWCNPDFRLTAEFLDKAYGEMNLRRNFGIMLLPPNIETEWFRKGITERGIRILHYPRRINFIDPAPRPDGQKRGGNNKGSILAAFSLDRVLPRVAGQPWWSVQQCHLK